MKNISYLSPTSIALYNKDPEEFYQRYLSEIPPPRDPQLKVMSIGSSTDAYIKSYLHQNLFGKDHKDAAKFEFNTLFTSQVESQNRDWAREHGLYVFNQYKSSGCLADIMLELQSAVSEPRFEFDVRGSVHGYREGIEKTLGEIVLLGKPDCSYVNGEGANITLDWKINGYLGTGKTYPKAGYIKLRSANRTDLGSHKDCFAIVDKGIKINCSSTLDAVDKEWAAQISVYSWLMGSPVGSDFIAAIDQGCCSYVPNGLPEIKFAQHRMKISVDFQHKLFNNILNIWEIVHSPHYFRDMSLEDSIERCRLLDGQAFGVVETPEDEWLQKVTKKPRY
jgi:hypothetical protein